MLEPEIAAFVAAVGAWYPANALARSPAEQRRVYERFAAAWTPASLPEGLVQEDAACHAPDGRAILLRCHRPAHRTPSGTVLFFHGGGFVVGSLDSHALITARLAADFGLAVIATDYRLAPEHPAPAALEDALLVTRAALDGRLPFGPLARPLTLAGDSAGGMLAAAVATALRDAACGGIDGIALVYPMLGVAPQPPACVTEAHAPMLTLADIDRYRALYWGDRPPPPATVPLDAARFDGLPPVLALGAEHDPLRDDARVYVERIRAAGGAARFWFGQGLVHGCWRAQGSSPQAARMHEVIGNFLRAPCA
ncbi:alpha/beta hydrolase [Verminephrobacter eiseniae]|uniref:Alpha/beta hydrolase fold-3 domain protein n=1 Tax=Verminephrobacter eiseniae (strain EF01-2) TaxID=391735 RepID=A1WPW5_VEREI|nr:alpha/beta hydrolase [Verminephrobacter eiseniae]ABM59672.1 Alpha/beta hydrolase fold-3 domain protein [Verminephrobacter eiseniae EF01-2]MCW5285188.1 alpha/beta hydrolase [Verminephrobacter eiseniae]MCW5302896.1 alpha/beta hydrolase [Verminephrobacter eiseniae]MCW8179835.1 alpha/beta hydrolase [Verminephrobacter eiseniae]MCW8190931.1 alpha/beta hydrolase [Verminephrobacter eiseniae]